jgi:uncharacterized membrane protein YphA (DoxX/SURF4 family)
MQRLFSMFPAGWPGVALLLLRVALSANLVHGVIEVHGNLSAAWVMALLATVAIALCVGLFTPVTAALCALIEIVIWHLSSGTIAALHVCAILVAVALAMLGPGAYSLDARLFGRRQVIFPQGGDSDDQ